MKDSVFGELEYKGGWCKVESINFWGRQLNLELVISAYENESPNSNQQDSYERFKKDISSVLKIAQKKLIKYIDAIKEEVLLYSKIKEIPEDLLEIITPKQILFMESGNYAILCDTSWDDNGIAIICKEYDILVSPQDLIWQYE